MHCALSELQKIVSCTLLLSSLTITPHGFKQIRSCRSRKSAAEEEVSALEVQIAGSKRTTLRVRACASPPANANGLKRFAHAI